MRWLCCTLLVAATAAAANDPAEPYFLRGIEEYNLGNTQEAHDSWSQCLELNSTRIDCMTNLASALDDLGNQQAAEELYRAVLSVEPEHADAAYNLALLLQGKDGAFRGASIDGRYAIKLYRVVVSADETRWDAWANMAAAIEELHEDPLLATRAYQRAIYELERKHEVTDEGEPDEDEIGYLAKLYYGLGMQLSSLTPAQCSELAAQQQSFLVGAEDGDDGTGSVCNENAQNALRVSTDLDPENAQAAHMLASISANGGGGAGDGPSVSKASPAFVKALFDDFSDSFDEKLAALEYRVPRLVGETVAAHVRDARRGMLFASAFDAGCGTGLAGPHLRPLVAGTLSGVDLSQKMLDRAATLKASDGRPVYDTLLAQDLLALTTRDVLPRGGAQGVELITAADVLVYFGDLSELLGVFGQLSAPASVLVFSCERVGPDESAPDGWLLRSSGRFAHTRAYVEATARAAGGFQLLDYHEIVPRMEHGKPVLGHLFVFVR